MNIWQWVNGWNHLNVTGITNDFGIFPLKQTLLSFGESARSALKGCTLNVRGLNCVYVTVLTMGSTYKPAIKVVFVLNTCVYLVMPEQELLTLQESCPLSKCQLCRQHLRVKQH